jgi:hypothetical protein
MFADAAIPLEPIVDDDLELKLDLCSAPWVKSQNRFSLVTWDSLQNRLKPVRHIEGTRAQQT